MKKESLVITTLVVIIIAAAAVIAYILTKPASDSSNVYSTDTSTNGLTEQQKIDTLISLNQSSTSKRLTNEERIKILQSLHK